MTNGDIITVYTAIEECMVFFGIQTNKCKRCDERKGTKENANDL